MTSDRRFTVAAAHQPWLVEARTNPAMGSGPSSRRIPKTRPGETLTSTTDNPTLLPVADRWWLLPRFRDRTPQPKPEPAAAIDRLMRQRPLAHTAAAALRHSLAA